jgi:hypothetical protein
LWETLAGLKELPAPSDKALAEVLIHHRPGKNLPHC